MACFWPMKCYVGPPLIEGKINVVFRRDQSLKGEELFLPCGFCLGCKLERSRQWAVRCMHEASLYEDNCFVTLTYDQEHLPDNMSLDVAEWQNFMKRLRKEYGSGIRFFHCGEYGSQFLRPHYHGLLFNHDFKDKKLFSEREGVKVYTSSALSHLWKKGFSTVGALTFKSAGYVARYNMKKIRPKDQTVNGIGLKPYERLTPYGEVFEVKPEYVTMSRRPGIGNKWFKKYRSDVFPSDEVVINGKSGKPPRYYDNLLDKEDVVMFNEIKDRRRLEGIKLVDVGSRVDGSRILVNDYTDPWRCEAREECARSKIRSLIRPMEAEI